MERSSKTTTSNVLLVVGAVVLGIALLAGIYHLAAYSEYRASWGHASAAEKLARARSAAAREPWNTKFFVRAKWLWGEAQLNSGDYNAAVQTLAEAYRLDVGNAELLALFKKAQDVQALETTKKAHLQHGHEGPGGTLTPQDIER